MIIENDRNRILTINFSKNRSERRRLARRNKQFQYEAEYRQVLAECDGDVETAELVMAINSIPEFIKDPPLVCDKPELRLV